MVLQHRLLNEGMQACMVEGGQMLTHLWFAGAELKPLRGDLHEQQGGGGSAVADWGHAVLTMHSVDAVLAWCAPQGRPCLSAPLLLTK